MADKIREEKRSKEGFGSSYRKGQGNDLRTETEIGTVLGGQVWMVKPDKSAKAANPCIWMKAGAVNFKNCNNYYDCTTCKYDFGMQKRVKSGKQISWQDSMRNKQGLNRVCRHSLTERIEKRACAYDYVCSKCDFDQYFEEFLSAKTESHPYEVQDIKGFSVPMGYYFHNGHTWAKIESGGYIRIGMDDFALKLLGKPNGFELPLMGKELDQGAVGWGMRKEDKMADVLSPVDGVIVEVNTKLREKPETTNEAPYSNGWLFMLRNPDIKGTLNKLMANNDSLNWMSKEVGVLENMIEETAGPLAADGGTFAEDIYGNIPQLGWENLTSTFLRT